MASFSFNPFLSPLHKLLREITPSAHENKQAREAFDLLQQQIKLMVNQHTLPPLSNEGITLVGSHFRGTDLSPLKHIDVFLQLDSSLVNIHEKGNTLSLVTRESSLSSCIDESLHLLPHQVVSTLQATFSKYFPTSISNTGQAIKIQSEHQKIEISLTPSFAWDHSFFIPQEHSALLWRRVSPLKEKETLDRVNHTHNGNIIPTIRCIKFWNENINNQSFRNYHVEAIAYFIFEEIPTPTRSVMDALQLYVNQMSRYIYNCPDPTGLDTPIHSYLHDNIDKWYLLMNRIAEFKTAIQAGEKALVRFLKQSTNET